MNTGPLQEQNVALPAKLSLQPWAPLYHNFSSSQLHSKNFNDNSICPIYLIGGYLTEL